MNKRTGLKIIHKASMVFSGCFSQIEKETVQKYIFALFPSAYKNKMVILKDERSLISVKSANRELTNFYLSEISC